jgi:hypothetical protein
MDDIKHNQIWIIGQWPQGDKGLQAYFMFV